MVAAVRRQSGICFFVFRTNNPQLSLNRVPESAWEGSCGDRVGQDGFEGWTATLAAHASQLPPRVPTNQHCSILELEDGKSGKALSATSPKGRAHTGAGDFGHIAPFPQHSLLAIFSQCSTTEQFFRKPDPLIEGCIKGCLKGYFTTMSH